MDTRQRSVVKAVVWNLLGLVTMTLVGLAATGSAALGFTLYLVYERVWAGIRWGRHV